MTPCIDCTHVFLLGSTTLLLNLYIIPNMVRIIVSRLLLFHSIYDTKCGHTPIRVNIENLLRIVIAVLTPVMLDTIVIHDTSSCFLDTVVPFRASH